MRCVIKINACLCSAWCEKSMFVWLFAATSCLVQEDTDFASVLLPSSTCLKRQTKRKGNEGINRLVLISESLKLKYHTYLT